MLRRPLAIDLLLACWDDDAGKLATDWSGSVPTGVAGAVLLDAVLDEVVTIQDDRVAPTGQPPSDPLTAELVETVTRRRRPPKPKTLVGSFGNSRRVHALRDRMVRDGILVERPGRALGLFPVTRHVPADLAAAEQLRNRLRGLLTGTVDPDDADDRGVILASLAAMTVALDRLVDRPDRKAAKQRAEAFRDGTGVSQAVADAIRDAQAAITTSVIAAGAAASASN